MKKPKTFVTVVRNFYVVSPRAHGRGVIFPLPCYESVLVFPFFVVAAVVFLCCCCCCSYLILLYLISSHLILFCLNGYSGAPGVRQATSVSHANYEAPRSHLDSFMYGGSWSENSTAPSISFSRTPSFYMPQRRRSLDPELNIYY